jgi:hypothetical protein
MTGEAPEDIVPTESGTRDCTPPSPAHAGEAVEHSRVLLARSLHSARADLQRTLEEADALAARLDQALRDLRDLRSFKVYAERLIAGLREAFHLRRMSLRRRVLRKPLPPALKPRWDQNNLDRLGEVIRHSGLFDSEWYRTTYPEAAPPASTPLPTI